PMSAAILAAADRGVDIKLVADKGTSLPDFEYSWLLLRKDLADSGQVKTAADLKGMKAAIPSTASLGEQTVELMAEEGKLASKDFEMSVVPFADQPAAFANKAIAASFAVEPLVARAVGSGFAVKWIPSSHFFSGRASNSCIFYGAALVKNKDLGQRFMVAYLKGVRDYAKAFSQTKEGRSDIVNMLVKYTTVKDPKLYDVMEMPYIDPNGLPDRPSMDAQYKWFVDKRYYQGKKTFDEVWDQSYADFAAQKLGKQ
ncbi:MAG: hypothetical protein M1358_12325, partial [Chloroflexi bacterium]|nr:hypothetical protein [Chloroflexota bacterium]